MSTVLKMASSEPQAAGPDETFTAQVRDRLAVRSPNWDRRYPHVLDLEAAVLADAHDETSGHSSALSGEQSPRHFRDVLLGERELTLRTICHLAITPNPAGPRAVRRLIRRLEAAMARPVRASLAESAGRLASEIADVSRETFLALEDGRSTLQELASVDRELADVEHAAVQMRQAVAAAMTKAESER
jgi:hypothetical protein